MSVIWEKESITVKELTDILNKNKSTVKTYVYRLERKHIIKVNKKVNPYRYAYNVKKEDYVKDRAEYIATSLFNGDKKKMLDVIK